MKKNGTYLVPQIALSHWIIDNGQKRGIPEYSLAKERQILPVIEANISHTFKAGVKVAYGTDAGVYPHGMNAYEFPAFVAAGLSPIDAIRTATTNAAALLGWSDRVGSVTPGKWADVIAIDGDPTQNVGLLQHVRFVMKSGKVYKNEYTK
jgi:imidazolonepropionase-like amidohydrolase